MKALPLALTATLLLALAGPGCDDATEQMADASAPDLRLTADQVTPREQRADAPAPPDLVLPRDQSPGIPDSAGSSGPKLSPNTQAGCFGWPKTPFSATNKAKPNVAGLKGSLAVDLSLKDLAGKPYTLSGLLATRPVLLVFGAFT